MSRTVAGSLLERGGGHGVCAANHEYSSFNCRDLQQERQYSCDKDKGGFFPGLACCINLSATLMVQKLLLISLEFPRACLTTNALK